MISFDISMLRNVKIEDYEEISVVLKRYPTSRSAYDIVNLMIWGTQFKSQWTEHNGRLLIYNELWTCILMPLGSYPSPDELKEIARAFYNAGKCSSISYVDNEYVAQFGDHLQEFEVVKDLNTADYIYLSERLAKLSGKKLQKKKNLISQFLRANGDYEVHDLSPTDGEECLQFSDEWKEEHPEDKEKGYKYEREAMRRAFQYFDRLALSGLVIRHNKKIIAFSIFSELKEDMAIIHFEKFARDVKGSAQIINWETAKHLNKNYQYINREEDMGIPGLRKSKLSYQPLMLLDSYKLKRKKSEQMAKVNAGV
ncbi:MAG: DUF2156 domain-containing protein [Candidatus Cloacimonetes bacterium]|nr:DUF2156 domain-containing protein [Candidatus Cloacimonadota bacterium]